MLDQSVIASIRPLDATGLTEERANPLRRGNRAAPHTIQA
jgi:hypothetical protein